LIDSSKSWRARTNGDQPRDKSTPYIPTEFSKPLLIVGLFALSGCSTFLKSSLDLAPSTPPGNLGRWEGEGRASKTSEASGKNPQQQKWSFDLEVVAKDNAYGRAELSGTFGTAVGTAVWTPTEARVLLPMQKRMIISPAVSGAFDQIMPVPISPQELQAWLFDLDFDLRQLRERGVSCLREGELETCQSPRGDQGQRSRGLNQRTFSAKSVDGASLELELTPIEAGEDRNAYWVLEAPTNFTVEKRGF